MTDSEMLTLAANAAIAAGMPLHYGPHDLQPEPHWQNGGNEWCPLADDGDALRLAVVLQLSVCNEHVQAGQVYCTRGDEIFPSVYSGIECDGPAADHVIPGDFSATRLAIFHAAVAIGKAME